MNTVTLHRIKCTPQNPHDFYVERSYRILTEARVHPPDRFKLQGVHPCPLSMVWFANDIVPIIEGHNGQEILDRWAVPWSEDPYHVTVAVCVNDVLVFPDLLYNTSVYHDDPQTLYGVAQSIYQAVEAQQPLASLRAEAPFPPLMPDTAKASVPVTTKRYTRSWWHTFMRWVRPRNKQTPASWN